MARAPVPGPLRELVAEGTSSIGVSPLTLAELLDARSLDDTLASFFALFRLPVRLLNPDGSSLKRSRGSSALNDYLAQLPAAAQLLGELHVHLTHGEPGESGELSHTAFTGATYHVGLIGHEGHCIGRFVIGPFITPEVQGAPVTLLACDPELDAERAAELLLALPRARGDTVRQIARHLAVTLDALIFAGHKARLIEHMHLSSLRENSRELAERRERERQVEERLARLELTPFRWLEGLAGEIDAERERGDWERLGALSTLLADLGRLERGALTFRREPIELSELLARVSQRLSAPARARLQVRCEAALGARRLLGDSERVAQAVAALIQNAADAASEGVELTIRERSVLGDDEGLILLSSDPPAFELELRVADTGPTLTEGERSRLFDVFCQEGGEVRGNAGRASPACTLRLALAQRLARAHRGALRIEDNAPHGAVHVIALPLAAAQLD